MQYCSLRVETKFIYCFSIIYSLIIDYNTINWMLLNHLLDHRSYQKKVNYSILLCI